MKSNIKEVEGDIIEFAKTGIYDFIVHGCNCLCTMGAGLALQIAQTWPEVAEDDLSTKSADVSKLGTIRCVQVKEIIVINAYTQFLYGRTLLKDGSRRGLNYDALALCLNSINNLVTDNDTILMPEIGCGLAGGNWKIVRTMIEEIITNTNIIIVHKP
jgi:O-acetyl-ADP-ribose deacetylase (regulator of RNase III)